MIRVIVDDEACTGHARCAATAPKFYSVDEEGFNTLKGQGPVSVAPDLELDARAGCDACPEGAITIADAGDGEER